MRRALLFIAFVLFAASCSMEKSPGAYITEAGALMQESRYHEAAEVMREAMYHFPEDYEVCLMMGRAAKEEAKKFIPGNRGLYLARHYFRRAASLAPDAKRAEEAEHEYDEVLALQGRPRLK